MPVHPRLGFALLLVGLAPAQAAAECALSGALPPHRKAGTAEVKVTGSRTAQGSFPAICGAYFVLDAGAMGKAGDGMVFETCLPGIGKLQVSGGTGRRKAGPVADFGLIVNTDTSSLMGSAGGANKVVLGADLFSATVKGKVASFGRPRPGKPSEELTLDVKFDCSK
jgi:hypothetical protein